MPEETGAGEILTLAADFPPVPTAAWEAAIRADLKGADYDKKLVWRTEEGLAVRPYYRSEDIAGMPPFPCRAGGHSWEIAGEAPGREALRVDWLHAMGATAVQELACALAMGVERLDGGAAEIPLVFAIGPYYFVEIAKFRAMRLLWAHVLAAFGKAPGDCPLRIAAITPRRNKSICDRYTNLLRATTEALSAVLGGCDSLVIDPFGFDPHLALNVQRILKEEAHLDVVADPAGGSYYIESLTAMLASEAWKRFQQIEAEGGYTKFSESGSLSRALGESCAARDKAVSSRRRALVGVNNYPNLAEKTPEMEPPTERGHGRLAEPFERIRARTAQMARETGRYPKVLLLKRGDLKMRMARANFCLNFFGCAGFDIVESEELAPADLIILCSSDPEYLALAREICPQTSLPVLVAGNPRDQIEALKAAGVQGFVHIQSDAIQTLTQWQERIAGGPRP